MRQTPRLGMLISLACVLSIAAIPAFAKDRPGFTGAENRALDTYEHCWKVARSDCGRNVVDDGYRLKSGKVRDATKAEVVAWTGRLERIISPPVVQAPVIDSPTGSTPAPTTSVPSTSAGGCPSYMAAEASSPSAVNPTSGASGCFQILPSTAAAHGCTDVGPSCAAAICATEGPGAWASSGANPCPYVQP